MKENKKSIQKCLRISQSVNDCVEQQPGNNFSEKFDNMVNHCIKEEKDINARIAAAQKILKNTEKRIEEKKELLSKLQALEYKFKNIFDTI